MVVVDDMNAYALRDDVATPHMDALQASPGAISFLNAYVQVSPLDFGDQGSNRAT